MNDDEDRVSLAGLDPQEALRAHLKVDPEAEPVAEWAIDIMAADEQTGDYSGVGDPRSRRIHWTGPAADPDAARAAAWAAWHQKYGPDEPSDAVTGTKEL